MKAIHISFERPVQLLPSVTRQQQFRTAEGWAIEVDGGGVVLTKDKTRLLVVGVPFECTPEPDPPEAALAAPAPMLAAVAHLTPETQQKHKRRR